ncbi:MAG: hypothetical protein OES24_14260 [Acidimicrobiia bacterium]|nr:hypothetical protein [Acidimicrobiia bacterium]
MNSDYVAWNGERYVWPPPEDWYLASDGRWWAPDTGPDMDLDPLPTESVAAEHGSDHQSTPVDDVEPLEPVGHRSAQLDTGWTSPLPTHDPGPAPYLFPDPGPLPDPEPEPSRVPELDATAAAYQTDFAEPMPSRPVSGQVAAGFDTDATAAMAADVGDSRRNPTMVMAEPPRTATGPNPLVAADPDTARHDRVSILEPTEETRSAGIQRSRTMPMVAAGLLAAAAIVIAALLSLLGGDNETQTQKPSASADETEGRSDELVVSTDDSGTPTSADGSMEEGAMGDGAMDDSMAEEGAVMTEEGQDATSTTTADGTGATANAALIGRFRALLEDNRITAAALTGDDLMVFGETACSYATSAGDLPEYEQIRDEALNGAQNDELSIGELQFVVDAAVTIFCTEDATRLGLTATAPGEG